jgi:GcrA cell cycle regulator
VESPPKKRVFPQIINQLSVNETPVLHHSPFSPHQSTASYAPLLPVPHHGEGRRRWTAGDLAEIVTSLATLSTSEIARTLGVNPKALRSALRRHGISLRAVREYAKKTSVSEGMGVVVRRSTAGPSAVYGAAALVLLPDGACRWPLGDPSKPDFSFCGAARFGRASYCRHHLAEAFEPGNRHGR